MGDVERNAKKQENYLGDDLIIDEILTRIPVKSVVRFKSVSKQWYSTLSSSEFAIAHLKKSPYCSPCVPVDTLFIKCGRSYYLLAVDDDDDDDNGDGDLNRGSFEYKLVPIDTLFMKYGSYNYLLSVNANLNAANFEDKLVKLDFDVSVCRDYLDFTGISNGLVCLTPLTLDYFVLWNPATRKAHKYVSDGFLKTLQKKFHVGSGFGYVASVDDYKYVRIVNFFGERTIVDVFSLKENKWSRIDFDAMLSFGKALFLNEKLYWVGHRIPYGYTIVCLDLVTEKFDMSPNRGMTVLGIMGECLYKHSVDIRNDIMELVEPSTTMKDIPLPNELFSSSIFEMVGFTRKNEYFVLADDPYGNMLLCMVNPAAKRVGCSVVYRPESSVDIAKYVPSLVSPFPFAK